MRWLITFILFSVLASAISQDVVDVAILNDDTAAAELIDRWSHEEELKKQAEIDALRKAEIEAERRRVEDEERKEATRRRIADAESRIIMELEAHLEERRLFDEKVAQEAVERENHRRLHTPDPPFMERDYDELLVLMSRFYDGQASVYDEDDAFLKINDLPGFYLSLLNPDDQEVSDAEIEYITKSVFNYFMYEGFADETTPVYHGFVTRGAPLRFAISLAKELREAREKSAQ